MRRILSLVGVLSALWLVQCGGSTDGDGTTGGSAGSGGSAASGGSSGSGGTSGSGGSAGDPSWFSCNVNSDCVLRSASCCGSCGAATRQDSIALNKNFSNQYTQATCGNDFGCAACFAPQDPTLTVTCEAGTCQVVDLSSHPATACQSASDCRVRTTDCCECGGATDPDHLIAVSNSGGADYAMLVCDPNIGCPECEPVYPKVPVDCIAGHCQLVTGND